ncbi:VOC family protein [Paraburkholderia strydomiana]|uniref:VOC family protein n=1 Tax=Paraburkholderia strydomiana TaxID=1245417 RepID=UPI0038BD78A2
MTAHPLRLDHLVISARTLDEGTQYVADTLGVAPAGGGAHPLMRTHNRLLNLWGGVYLEVIAIDPHAAPAAASAASAASADPGASADASAPRPRLFALDDPATHARLENGPYLSHWVARVERPKQLRTWRAQFPQRIPPIVPMTRGDFTWGLSVPDDGAFPAWQGTGDGVLPSLIQWDSPRHPSDALPPTGIALKALKAVHPQADLVRAQLQWLGAAHLLELQSTDGAAALVAEFETPDGLRTLK